MNIFILLGIFLVGIAVGYIIYKLSTKTDKSQSSQSTLQMPPQIIYQNPLTQEQINDINQKISELQKNLLNTEDSKKEEKILYYYPQYPNPYLYYGYNRYWGDRYRDRDRYRDISNINNNQNVNVNVPPVPPQLPPVPPQLPPVPPPQLPPQEPSTPPVPPQEPSTPPVPPQEPVSVQEPIQENYTFMRYNKFNRNK